MAERRGRRQDKGLVLSGKGHTVVRRRTSEPEVDRAIEEIRRGWNGRLLQAVIWAGHYLIEHFYGGMKNARDNRPHKEAALARLMARADELPLSVHALQQAVRIAIQAGELPRALSESLTVTQHEKLLVLRDGAQRRALAEAAVAESLSARELQRRVRRVRPPHAGGRKPLHPLARGLAAAVRALSAQDITDGLETLRELDEEAARALDVEARRARELLERISDGLGRRLRGARKA